MIDFILGCVLVILGSAISMYSIGTALLWRSARSWPRVKAVLRSATIEKRRNPIGATMVVEQYRPKVTYDYRFGGREYTGRRITFLNSRLWDEDRSKAEESILRLGRYFEVAVSPRQPHKSVIEIELTSRERDFLGVLGVSGLLIAGVGIWVVWIACSQAFLG